MNTENSFITPESFYAFFNYLPESYILLDFNGKIIAKNRCFTERFEDNFFDYSKFTNLLSKGLKNFIEKKENNIIIQAKENQSLKNEILFSPIESEDVEYYLACIREKESNIDSDVILKSRNDELIQINETYLSINEEFALLNNKLIEERKKFEILANLSPAAIYMTDEKGDCIYVNKKWEEISGLTLNEAEGQGWVEGIYHKDREKVYQAWYKMVESKGQWGVEYRFINKQNKITWVYSVASELTDDKEKVIGYIGSALVINDLKNVRNKLKLSQKKLLKRSLEFQGVNEDLQKLNEELTKAKERYTLFINNSYEGVARSEFREPLDVKLSVEKQIEHCFNNIIIAECNDSFAKQYGFDNNGDLVGKPVKIIFQEGKEMYDVMKLYVESGYRIRNIETEEITQNGKRKFFLTFIESVIIKGFVHRLWLTQIDISEKKEQENRLKQSEKTLRESKALYQSLVDSIPMNIFRKDLDGKITFVNKTVCLNTNKEEKDWMGLSDYDVFSEELANKYRKDDNHVIKTKKPLHVIEENVDFNTQKNTFVETIKIPIFNYKGQVKGIQGISWDITTKIDIEKEREEAITLLKATLNGLSPNVALLNETGKILLVNKAWNDFTVKSELQLHKVVEGTNYLETCENVTGKESAITKKFANGIKKVLNGDLESFALEYPCNVAKEQMWFLGRITLFPSKNFRGVVVAHENITDQKLAIQALRKSEEINRSLISSLSEGIVLHNPDGSIALVNSAAEKVLSLTYNQLVGIQPIDFQWETIHEDGSPFPGEEHPSNITIATGKPQFNVIMGVLTHGENLKWIIINSVPVLDEVDNQLKGVAVSFTDITAMKDAELKVKESEQRYRLLADNSIDVISRHNSNGAFVFASPTAEKIFGISPLEIIKYNLYDFIHPEEKESLFSSVDRLLEQLETERLVYRVVNRKGSYTWVESLSRKIINNNDEVEFIILTRDITKRKETEIALTSSEREKTNILGAINNAALVSITDLKGVITNVNDKFCEVSGYSSSELIGSTHKLISSGHHPASFWAEMWKVIKLGRPWRGEVKNKIKNSGYYWVDTVITPIFNSEGNIYEYMSIRYLITDKKELFEQKEAMLKDLEDYAFLTSHKIRGPLARMLGLTDVIMSGNLKLDEFNTIVEMMKNTSEEMDAIIKEMNTILSKTNYYDKK